MGRLVIITAFVLTLIFLISPIKAALTFFENPDDAFIIGNPTTGESAQESGANGEITEGGCLTNWACIPWSSCINGIQTRNCTKIKDHCYADLKKKPIESQNCSIDKSKDRKTSLPNENERNIDNLNLFSIKIIILVILVFLVIGFIILYKRHFRNIKSKVYISKFLKKYIKIYKKEDEKWKKEF